MKKLLAPFVLLALMGFSFGCASSKKAPEIVPPPAEETAPAAEPLQAIALLSPTEGSIVQGTVRFVQEEEGVRVIAEVSGLPQGPRGFHIHEVGDCSAPDASSAGGHFNPFDTDHGKVGEGTHHVGDLPSLEADENGIARLDVTLSTLSLSGDASIVGRGLIVHADADDYVTQPTGNAGARVACAVIQLN